MRRLVSLSIVSALLACGRHASERERPGSLPAHVDSIATAESSDSLQYGRGSLPRPALELLFRHGFFRQYSIIAGLNPYYLRGWFDADSLPDIAIQIKDPASGKRGIAIIHSTDSTVHILGAGTPLGNGGDDFNWLWIWRVEPRSVLPEAPAVGREVLYVEKPEAASGYIWWNGRAYVWTQGGD